MLTERNSNMKKIVFFLAFVLCAQLVAAQSMTDEQVVNFIMAEHQNGVSEMEITKKLLKKGVSVEQIKKIGISLKAKADKKSGVGAIDDDDAQASKRVRYTPKSGDYPVSQSSTKVKSKQAKRKSSKNEPLYDYFNSDEKTEEVLFRNHLPHCLYISNMLHWKQSCSRTVPTPHLRILLRRLYRGS